MVIYGGASWTGGKSCFIATNTQLDKYKLKYKLNQFLLRDFFGHMLTNDFNVCSDRLVSEN